MHPGSKSMLATVTKIGNMHSDPSAPFITTCNVEKDGPSTSAMIGEAKGFLKATNQVIPARGIAEELSCPQAKPTTMYQDNLGLLQRLNHLVPATEATKAHSRMLNHLRHLVKNGDVHPEWVESKMQPSDPMSKRTTPSDNIRSLPMLQGHQPAIAKLRDEYAAFRGKKPISSTHDSTKLLRLQHTLDETVAAALATMSEDGYLRFPFQQYVDMDDDSDIGLQEAQINSWKNESSVYSSRRVRYDYIVYFNSQLPHHHPTHHHNTKLSWSPNNKLTYVVNTLPQKSIILIK
jgi:hypothetical protein